MPHQSLSQLQTIIFDFDGTLADSLQIHLQLYNQLAIKHGRSPIAIDEVRQLQNLSMRQFLRHQQIPLWRLPGLIREARQLQQEQKLEPAIFPQIKPVIKQLSSQYQLGIITSNQVENVERFLERHAIRNSFDWIYAEKKLFGKHHKLKDVLHRHQLKTNQVCYVGDEVRDVEATKKVGLPMIAVSWGFNSPAALAKAEPLAVISAPKDLLQLL